MTKLKLTLITPVQSYTLTMSTKEGVERCFSRLRRPSSSRDAVRTSIARCLFRFFFHWNTRSATSVWSAEASFSGGRRPLERHGSVSYFFNETLSALIHASLRITFTHAASAAFSVFTTACMRFCAFFTSIASAWKMNQRNDENLKQVIAGFRKLAS